MPELSECGKELDNSTKKTRTHLLDIIKNMDDMSADHCIVFTSGVVDGKLELDKETFACIGALRNSLIIMVRDQKLTYSP